MLVRGRSNLETKSDLLADSSPESTEKNRVIVRRFLEALWTKEFPVNDQFSFVDQTASIQSLKKQLTGYRENFFDLQISVQDQIAEGDKVAVRLAWRGSSHVEFGEYAPTTAVIEWTDFAIFQLKNGKITGYWGNSGLAGGTYHPSVADVVQPASFLLEIWDGSQETGTPPAATVHGLVTTQQDLLNAKDRQIEELHLLLSQAQTILASLRQPPKRTSWWRRLLDGGS